MFNLDENFWIAVSFAALLYIMYRPLRRILVKFIDDKINEIKEQVSESEKLKQDAKELLDFVEEKINSIDRIKGQFLSEYENETDKILEQKKEHLHEQIDDLKYASIQEIKYYQNKINKKIKDSFSDLVTSVLTEYFKKSENTNFSDKEIIDKFSK